MEKLFKKNEKITELLFYFFHQWSNTHSQMSLRCFCDDFRYQTGRILPQKLCMLGMMLTKVRQGRLGYTHQIFKNRQKSQQKKRKSRKKVKKHFFEKFTSDQILIPRGSRFFFNEKISSRYFLSWKKNPTEPESRRKGCVPPTDSRRSFPDFPGWGAKKVEFPENPLDSS